MKISDVLGKLNKVMCEHGDLEAVIADEEGAAYPIEDIDFGPVEGRMVAVLGYRWWKDGEEIPPLGSRYCVDRKGSGDG